MDTKSTKIPAAKIGINLVLIVVFCSAKINIANCIIRAIQKTYNPDSAARYIKNVAGC
ncbi:MAG: hypothetical protein WCH10_06230 [bacterium]